MPNTVEINTVPEVTAAKFAVTFQKNGNAGCIPVINGEPAPMLMFGYVSESDKEACARLIAEAVNATDGNIYAAAQYIRNAVSVSAHGIKANEAVDVDGYEMIISYADRKIYAGTDEVANLDDVDVASDNIIKAMLIDRARLKLAQTKEEYCCDDECIIWW